MLLSSTEARCRPPRRPSEKSGSVRDAGWHLYLLESPTLATLERRDRFYSNGADDVLKTPTASGSAIASLHDAARNDTKPNHK